jgi:hypothetical protein
MSAEVVMMLAFRDVGEQEARGATTTMRMISVPSSSRCCMTQRGYWVHLAN